MLLHQPYQRRSNYAQAYKLMLSKDFCNASCCLLLVAYGAKKGCNLLYSIRNSLHELSKETFASQYVYNNSHAIVAQKLGKLFWNANELSNFILILHLWYKHSDT